MRRPWLRPALVALVGLLACGSPPPPRVPSPDARLAIGVEAFVDDGPFRLVFAGPQGEGASASEVTLAFSRPLRAPALVGAAAAPASIRRVSDAQPIAGSWRWFGERTAVFWPSPGQFARATAYEVVVDPSLRAFDGSALDVAPSFKLATLRPALESASYAWNEAADRHEVTLEFNQPTPAAELHAALRVEGTRETRPVSVPFELEQGDAPTRFRLILDRSVLGLKDVVVVTAASLQSSEGPLRADREARVPIADLSPQQIDLYCVEPGAREETPGAKRCSLERGSIELRLSKPVRARELLRRLVVSSPRRRPEVNDDELVSDLALDSVMQLLPGKKYRITVKAGLSAWDKERLAADRSFELVTAELEPRLELRDIGQSEPSAAIVVEAQRPTVNFALEATNVAAVDAVLAPAAPALLPALLERTALDRPAIAALPGAVVRRVALGSAKNRTAYASFELPTELREAGRSGTFALGLSAPGIAPQVRLVSVTDLGLTTKWSSEGGLVWVTRLSSGQPVPQANVSVRAAGTEAFAATTDALGVVTIPAPVAARLVGASAEPIVLVQAEGDTTFTRLPRLRPASPIGLIFTDRRLYRPGEVAFVKGMLRSPSNQGLVARPGQRLQVEAEDHDGHTWFSQSVTLDAFGSFSCEVPIPRVSRLGFASVRARLATEEPDAINLAARRPPPTWQARAYFSIDEFRAVEMKLSVSSKEKEYLAGDEAELELQGRYLFDAPMHDAEVELHSTRRPTRFSPVGLRDFESDAGGFWPAPAEGLLGDQRVQLDSAGAATARLGLKLPGQVGPEQVSVDASIEDVSRAFAVGDQTTIVVHPSELYVGVRLDPNGALPAVGKPFRAEVAAAGWYGPARAGVPVEVALYRSPEGGQSPIDTGQSCQLVTRFPEASCSLVASEPGAYWLTAQAVDASGRAARAALRLEVARQETPRPPAPRFHPSPPEPEPLPFDLACRLDRNPLDDDPLRIAGGWSRRYEVGELVHACLRGSGPTLLTEERDGLLRYEVVSITRPGSLRDFEIRAAHHPSFQLALHAPLPRSSPFPDRFGVVDRGHPSYLADEEQLNVARPSAKRLKIAIAIGKEHRPGAELEARLRVTDADGKPSLAQVTFWAVDEGVLELEPYRAPEPEEIFGEERASDVHTHDTRAELLWQHGLGSHQTRAPKVRMGGTRVSPRAHIGRSVFRPTAWFLPSLLTGADGVAHAHLKLPDNVTTWRVFAVAQSLSDAFGTATSSFVTKQPLLARPALPRFLRAGDRFEAAVVVDSAAQRPLDVTVQLTASGAFDGEGRRTVRVPAQGHVPVRFAAAARTSGLGRVAFHVNAPGGLADDVASELEVSVPTTLETIVLSGQTSSRVDEPLGDLRRARPDVGGLELRLSSSPLAGLAESLASLIDYPYGCTEQLASRLLPLVRLRGLARAVDVPLPRDTDAAIRTGTASLLSHQQPDGGFGFWPESAHSEAWLTAFAVSALLTSQQAGYAVPQAAIDRALAWLAAEKTLDRASATLLEDLFASLGRARVARLRELAHEPDSLPRFAQALLGHALLKVDPALARQVIDHVVSHAQLTGSSAIVRDEADLSQRAWLSSDARTTALTLRALAAADQASPLVPKLVRGLLALRRNGRWSTTQENAWALLALDELRLGLEPASAAASLLVARFDGLEVARATDRRIGSATLSMSRLLAAPGARLSFTSDRGPLYYEAALRYARQEPAAKPLEQGIHVARTLKITRRGAAVVPTDLRVGDSVEIDVVLASSVARELVVLDDPIPAGFEAVNRTFADTEPWLGNLSGGDVTHRELRDDRVVSYFDHLPAGVTHTSYHLRAIAAGRFAHPPAKAECMYAPDVFGRTAASVVETH
jgi:uncharacterized protein YfaS (alpha-2-macroglobulin family)